MTVSVSVCGCETSLRGAAGLPGWPATVWSSGNIKNIFWKCYPKIFFFRTLSGYAGAEQADTSGHIHGVLHTITKQVEGEISKVFFGNVTVMFF